MSENIIEVSHITKRFPGVVALNDVSFSVRKGSVHALIGENGAGKSTLMKILAGQYQPDEGKILIDGEETVFKNPQEALNKGISMIYQELMPVDEMTVADNIYLGRYPKKMKGLVDKKEEIRLTKEALSFIGADHILPSDLMKDLNTAGVQMVEIAKAVSRNAKLIIMDEPTSSITDAEVENLFNVIRQLKEQNIGIIYISHKLDELFEIADEITVFRDGQYIATDAVSNFDQARLVKLMVGRDLKDFYSKDAAAAPSGEKVLEVKNLSSGQAFHNISFDLYKGEILGIAGLVGAGRTEMVESIFGMRKITGGTISKDGKPLHIRSPKDAIRNRIALATEDRKRLGLFLPFSIAYNTSISWLNELSRAFMVNGREEKKVAGKSIKSLSIKAERSDIPVGNLSGGNQQKVVLAKWLLTNPDILMLDEPTRGIDVGAKHEIYGLMEQLAHEGKSIIMISSEMPELLGVADRIIVFSEGKKTAEMSRAEATQEKIGKYL